MNISRVVTALITQYGLSSNGISFKSPTTGESLPIENEIQNIIANVTIPTYSQFEPWIRTTVSDVKDLKLVDRKESIYVLPPLLLMTPIIALEDVSFPYRNVRNNYGDISTVFGMTGAAQGMINANAYALMAGKMRAEPTFEFIYPNKVRLFGFPRCPLEFTVTAEHLPNLETVPNSCYDSFMQLASLDIKMALWNNLKHYQNVASAHGEINLKIDQFEQAESERNELLNTWRETFHLDRPEWIKFM